MLESNKIPAHINKLTKKIECNTYAANPVDLQIANQKLINLNIKMHLGFRAKFLESIIVFKLLYATKQAIS